MEDWRPIYGYTGYYEVSSLGRVRNVKTGRILKPRGNLSRSQLEAGRNTVSYLQVALCRNKVHRNHYVHILVMRNFVGKRPAGKDVAHADDDASNNRLDNLSYASASRNRGRHKPNCICPWCREADVQCDGDDLLAGVDYAQIDLEQAPF